jgi:hypothetical protein
VLLPNLDGFEHLFPSPVCPWSEEPRDACQTTSQLSYTGYIFATYLACRFADYDQKPKNPGGKSDSVVRGEVRKERLESPS